MFMRPEDLILCKPSNLSRAKRYLLSYFASYCHDKHKKTNLTRREFAHLTAYKLHCEGKLGQELKAGTRLDVGTETEALEECCLLDLLFIIYSACLFI